MASIPNRFGTNDHRNPVDRQDREEPSDQNALVSWVMKRVKHGRQQRDTKYSERWKEYTRLWRGMWDESDRNNDGERSKLIAPALQQAIEMTTSEIEESVFGREAWFGTEDDDNQPEDVIQLRDNLLKDFDSMKVENNLSEAFLLGCIYGTGIAKINVIRHKEMGVGQNGNPEVQEKVKVRVDAIRPDEFVVDPAATSVEEALFCAHEPVKPRHTIKEKQAKGVYRQGHIGVYSGANMADTTGGSTSSMQPDDDSVLITEYYGKVPASMLPNSEEGEKGMVEAIVVIANESTLLRAVKSPFTMKDRPIVAYQHDTVPGEFWGRGVAEKGYNPQKALDSELRARVDALALMTAPMMGADITRIPRNPELRVRPGKTVFTRGRPSEIYEPVAFGDPGQLGATFQHSGDLERMVQMGTGAMDSQTPANVSRRNETAGGMSMMLSGALKRTKRTLFNIERQFLKPLIRKSLWRYIQFDPSRYPQDYNFQIHSTMGIMAKEVENQNLTQVLNALEPGSREYGMVLTAFLDNVVSSEKRSIVNALKSMNEPPSEEEIQMQRQAQQLKFKTAQAEYEKTVAEIEELRAEVAKLAAETEHTRVEADLEDDKVQIQAANAATAAQKVRVQGSQTEVNADKNQVEREKNENDSGDNSGESS